MDTKNNHVQGYDENFVEKEEIETKYRCPICFLVMKDTVQTYCGHKFCQECLSDWMKESEKTCPICKNKLNKTQIFHDICTSKEIFALMVYCRNSDQKCTWKGPLKQLDAHIKDECLFTIIDCPNNCCQQILRNQIDEHNKDICPNRKIECEHCQESFKLSYMSQHLEICHMFPLECELCHDSEKITRAKMEDHLNNYCHASQMKCPFEVTGCKYQDLRQQMKKHLEDNNIKHMRDLVTMIGPVEKYQELQKDLQDIQFKMATTEIETSIATDRIKNLAKVMDERVYKNMDVLRGIICNGTYIWKIFNWSQEVQRARFEPKYEFFSLPFYTSAFGYKMCLRINPMTTESTVSIYVHLMKGEWDDTLEWPFFGSIQVTMLDRIGNCHMINKMKVDNGELETFQKPKYNEMVKSTGYGFPFFIKLEEMNMIKGFIKDNTVLIKCVIKSYDRC